MTADGSTAACESKSSRSIRVASLEKTLKCTPSGQTVAPSGWGESGVTERSWRLEQQVCQAKAMCQLPFWREIAAARASRLRCFGGGYGWTALRAAAEAAWRCGRRAASAAGRRVHSVLNQVLEAGVN